MTTSDDVYLKRAGESPWGEPLWVVCARRTDEVLTDPANYEIASTYKAFWGDRWSPRELEVLRRRRGQQEIALVYGPPRLIRVLP